MQLSVYLPLLLSAVFGVSAPALGRRLPPAAATWFLSAGGLFAALGAAASLMLLGSTLIGQNAELADRGHWSDAALRQADPVSTPVAAVAMIALSVVTVRLVVAAARRLGALRASYRLAAALPATSGELAVIDAPGRNAYAVPGRPGRIVVSAALLRSLDAGERRALLAHERAHLTHHHHVHQSLAHLAAALNPLLWRIPAATALSTERWADEEAAAVSRRTTVASALTRAAVDDGAARRPAGPRSARTPAVVLAAAATHVQIRVSALHAPAPRPAVWRVTVLLGLLAATALGVVQAAQDADRLFDLAQYAYLTGQR